MESSVVMLLQEYLVYEIEKMSKNIEANSLNMNLRTVGTNLGYKVMLKLASQAPLAKTKDVNASIKFFVDVFWDYFFGKKISVVHMAEANKASFSDPDFELITRTSSRGHDMKVFQEHTKNLVRYVIEGAMAALSIKSNVDVQFAEGKTSFSIECTEAAN